MKPTEDMNKEERKLLVAELDRARRAAIDRIPLLTPEQSASCRLTNEAAILKKLAQAEQKQQDRFRRWIEQGGSLEHFE